jgi:hypothetical protein
MQREAYYFKYEAMAAVRPLPPQRERDHRPRKALDQTEFDPSGASAGWGAQ